MSDFSVELRLLVVQRAENRCEYCLLSQTGQEAIFHIDHVVPRVEGGPTTAENLALACVSCSLRKGSRRSMPDPLTGSMVALFNPRQNRWHEHFRWNHYYVEGLTGTGRATVEALAMNRPNVLEIRERESRHERQPWSDDTGNGRLS